MKNLLSLITVSLIVAIILIIGQSDPYSRHGVWCVAIFLAISWISAIKTEITYNSTPEPSLQKHNNKESYLGRFILEVVFLLVVCFIIYTGCIDLLAKKEKSKAPLRDEVFEEEDFDLDHYPSKANRM